MRIGRASVVAALVVSLLVMGASPAHAAGSLDQNSYTGSTDGVTDIWTGPVASFTAGVSGPLTEVRIYAKRMFLSPNYALIASIVEMSETGPTGTVLASASAAPGDLPTVARTATWIPIRFVSPTTVVAGQVYGIRLQSESTYEWLGNSSNPYSRGGQYLHLSGSWYSYPGYDMAFETYVDSAPEVAQGSQRTLRLDGSGGVCSVGQSAATDGAWVRLPAADACTESGMRLLGWSTSPDFPIERARIQSERGWGAIDETINGVRMIFIPAGGYAFVTGDNNLFAIWG